MTEMRAINLGIGIMAYIKSMTPMFHMVGLSRISADGCGISGSMAIYVTVALLSAVCIEVHAFKVIPEGVTVASGASTETQALPL